MKTSLDYLSRIDRDRIKDSIADMADAQDMLKNVTTDLEQLLKNDDLSSDDRTNILHLLGTIDSISGFVGIVRQNIERRILYRNFDQDQN